MIEDWIFHQIYKGFFDMLRRSIVLILIALIFLVSCQKSENQTDRLRIATSVLPIADICQQLTGERAEVLHAVPVGANPHTYEPLPSGVRALQTVDLFIGIHPHFDGWIQDFLPASARTVFLLDQAQEERDHAVNPHIWLSVRQAKEIAVNISGILMQIDREGEAVFRRNLINYSATLDTLDQEIRQMFTDVQNGVFFQWHPAWDAFAAEYGLRIAGTIAHGHGDEPSVRDFQSLIQIAQRDGVKRIVIGLDVQSETVQSLANEISGQILRLDTIGDPSDPERSSYCALMRTNARRLAVAFRNSGKDIP